MQSLKYNVCGKFFIITVCQRWHGVQVQAAAQVGDLVPGYQAEQPVKAIVAHHTQSAVALDAAFQP